MRCLSPALHNPQWMSGMETQCISAISKAGAAIGRLGHG